MRHHSKVSTTLLSALALTCFAVASAKAETTPRYYEDVLPIFQENCLSCHRQGAVAPMAFDSFAAARPWAKSIQKSVMQRNMPPWLADPKHGVFSNAMQLTDAEIDTIVKWATAGAPAGDPSKAPAPKEFPEWEIGAPDQIFTMPSPYTLAPEGQDEYKYFTVSEEFPEDKWVTGLEVKAGNTNIVHHVIAFVLPPGAKDRGEGGEEKLNSFRPESDEKAAEAVRKGEEMQEKLRAAATNPRPLPMMGQVLGGVAPGTPPWIARPGEGRLIKKGSRIYLQMHYHRNGLEETDQTSIGVKYAAAPVQHERKTVGIANVTFAVPPMADNYKVESFHTFDRDVKILSFMPHMHLRGKAFEYRAKYPDGREETLMSVPNYDFAWQYTYELAEPISIPKGTLIHCIAHFDNSANNTANPDPLRVVKFGNPTEDEMMIGWMDVVEDEGTIPNKSTKEVKELVSSAQ
jgi:mono/diheme cytochrome c family protein